MTQRASTGDRPGRSGRDRASSPGTSPAPHSRPVDEPVVILENKKINPKYFRLSFRSKRLAAGVLPGQFLNLQIEPSRDPFLRRPFSYYRVQDGRVEVLYEILGRGTGLLAGKRAGDTLRVMGPLGRPFTQKLPKGRKRVLLAGGVGVPPLVFLAERCGADCLLIGVKSKGEVLPGRELAKVRAKVKVLYSSNDGSYGRKGFVTAILEDLLKKENASDLFIQTCGPAAMMEAVLRIARREGIPGEMSVDRPMACGVGACLGCMVMTKDGWKTSCVDGPVFGFREIEEP